MAIALCCSYFCCERPQTWWGRKTATILFGPWCLGSQLHTWLLGVTQWWRAGLISGLLHSHVPSLEEAVDKSASMCPLWWPGLPHCVVPSSQLGSKREHPSRWGRSCVTFYDLVSKVTNSLVSAVLCWVMSEAYIDPAAFQWRRLKRLLLDGLVARPCWKRACGLEGICPATSRGCDLLHC